MRTALGGLAAAAALAAATPWAQAPEPAAAAPSPSAATTAQDNARAREDAARASTSPGTSPDDAHGYREGNMVGQRPGDTPPARKGDRRREKDPVDRQQERIRDGAVQSTPTVPGNPG